MGWEAWLTAAVIAVTVAALARDWVAPSLAVLGAVVVLLTAGVIDTAAAFAGFSNPAPITVAALFVIARAVEKTGALQPLLAATLGDGRSRRGGLARLLLPTAAASAFLNNTPIVAMLAPQVADWAEKRGRAASWYLMPLSFATILGGTLTVVGTSTNLVVSGLMEAAGMEPMGVFEITRIGLPVALVGLATVVALAPLVLPDRRPPRSAWESDVREFVVALRVVPGGPLDGATIEEGGLRHLQGVFLVEVEREGEALSAPAPTLRLRGGDRLAFAGRVDQVRDLQRMRGLAWEDEDHAAPFNSVAHTFFEVVVSGSSPLVGRTLKEVGFRDRYQAAVLAIHRSGSRVNEKLGTVRLREGDTLMVLSDAGFAKRWRHRSDFLLVSHLGGTPPPGTRQALLVWGIAVAIVVLAGVGLLPILHAALLGALGLIATGALTPSEARGAVDLDVVVLIAASFGLGAAIEASGLAAVVGHGIVAAASGWGTVGVLLAVTLATVVLTELITNNAAAVLLFPIAAAAAGDLGLDPRPFAIAVAVAASASFLTPIGYQTNTMVYGPGGYRFGDYARLGAPLTLVVIATVVLLVPMFWPLRP